MATIITRETGAFAKDAPLTNAEVDNNFILLYTLSNNNSAGLKSVPTITDNQDGTITLSSVDTSIFSNSNYSDELLTYTVSESTITLQNNQTNFIIIDYNAGTPIFDVTSDGTVINESDILPVFDIYKEDTELYIKQYDSLSNGLNNKLHHRIKCDNYIESGLEVSERNQREIEISNGYIWNELDKRFIGYSNSIDSVCNLYYKENSVWNYNRVFEYSNKFFQGTTNVQTLIDDTYGTIYVYKCLTSDNIRLLYGTKSYATLKEAQYSSEPTDKPDAITYNSILVGRIIIFKNDESATSIDDVIFKNSFSSNVIDHNETINKQGGGSDEYYHLTNTEKSKLGGVETGAEVNNISDTDATDLTDSGDSTLHYHSADRDRANHTGTQPASTISDFDTAVKASETVTSLSLATNILTYVDEAGTSHDIDLSLYLDDTNLARLTSGTLDGATGIATFTRDDATTFTVDFSALLDDTQVTVEDNLTSTSADNALSANQGRVLNNQHIALRESVAELDINPIIYDDFGDANCMVRIPKFRLEDIDASLGTGIHPAFIVNGVEKDAIYYGQYPASVKGSNYVSVPNADPANTINFDEALAACAAKGNGWHMSTNAEWSALALWAWKNGTMPHGNNNYGRDVDYKYETGRLTDPAAILGDSGTARTATGTGPATWAHDHTMHGVHDMNGNVLEWQGGLRINDGEIQVLADNNAADSTKDQSATSSEWKAILQDGSLVTPGTADTLKYDATDANGAGSPILNTTLTSQSTGTEYSYAYFESLSAETGVSAPALMIALGMYPVGTGLGGDKIFVRNVGERLPPRSGYWSSSTNAGVFSLNLIYDRSVRYSYIGFRPAFVI